MSDEGEDSRPVERRRAALQFEGFGVKVGFQGYSLRLVFDMVGFGLLLLIGSWVWDTRTDVDTQQTSIAAGNAQIVAAIRYQTCIFSLPEEERHAHFKNNGTYCEMMGGKK